MAVNVIEISAGNQTSILQKENGEVFVCGNNTYGQIGIGSTANTASLTKVDIGKSVEIISAGHGTHTALADTDGFVYMTGRNVYGELGSGNNTNTSSYMKIGSTIVETDKDIYYLDINETQEIKVKLINTFNLKVDIVDDNKQNFALDIETAGIVNENDKVITATNYGETKVTVTHTGTGKTKEITIKVVTKMQSIVQGFRDMDLLDGKYTVMIEDELYDVELINIYGDTTYSLNEGETSKIVSLGDNSAEYKTLVVKYHGDLTIDEGVTVTANTYSNGLTYKKGMYLCVLGDIVNNGTITMTARGTYNQEGQNVYLWKNIDNSYEYVPKEGADGVPCNKDGKSGEGRQTGGGRRPEL